MPQNPHVQTASDAIQALTNIDTADLPQEKKLGEAYHFNGVVEPADRLLALYRALSLAILPDLPASQLSVLSSAAQTDLAHINRILEFDAKASAGQHQEFINAIVNAYDKTFPTLAPLIAYSAGRTTDLQRLEADARAAIQRIQDESAKLVDDIRDQKTEIGKITENVRAAAAEIGVSQQAIFFQKESTAHRRQARDWLKKTLWAAAAVGLFAVFSAFAHRIPWLKVETNYDFYQLAFSKLLVFAVLSYVLYLCGRNYTAHRHNAVVNKHRQNALLTYAALTDAASSTEYQNVVLAHAAACIYQPLPTGYSTAPPAPANSNVIEILGKAIE